MVRICSNQSMIEFVNSFAFWNEFRWHCLRSIHAICSIASECLTCSDVFVKYWIRIDSGYCSIVKCRLKYTELIEFARATLEVVKESNAVSRILIKNHSIDKSIGELISIDEYQQNNQNSWFRKENASSWNLEQGIARYVYLHRNSKIYENLIRKSSQATHIAPCSHWISQCGCSHAFYVPKQFARKRTMKRTEENKINEFHWTLRPANL